MTAKLKLLDPIHPGEILLEVFMKPMGISINKLARDLAVPPGRISGIVNGRRAVSADMARLPLTMPLMRPGGTARSRAS